MILPIQIPTRLLVEDMGGKPNYCCFSASKFISLAKSTESGWMLRAAGQARQAGRGRNCCPPLSPSRPPPPSPMVGSHPNILHPNIFFGQDVLKLDGNKGLTFSYQRRGSEENAGRQRPLASPFSRLLPPAPPSLARRGRSRRGGSSLPVPARFSAAPITMVINCFICKDVNEE